MRIGVQLPEVERVVRHRELAAMARAAEEVGLDSIWVGDHLLYREPDRGPWDCFATLAWLAGITERVELGPLVACTAFHPPGVLARMCAAVDELSGGRFVAALGCGWNDDEFRAFGFPLDHRVSRFEEAFEIVRCLLVGETVTFHGRFHDVEGAALLPPPTRKPKLMIGANAPRMLAISLPHVDAWNTWFTHYGNTPEGFTEHNAYVSEQAEKAGRDPAEIERSACVFVTLDGGSGARQNDERVAPLDIADLPAHLDALAKSGADEAILVLDPITEQSIRSLRTALPSA